MIQARQMHPMEMKYLIPELSRATGKSPDHLARRLSQPHRHGCILLQHAEVPKPGTPSGVEPDSAPDLDEDDGQSPICGFQMYSLDHRRSTAWLLESAVYPKARPDGRGMMVRKLSEDLEAMGLAFRTVAMVPEDDPAGMDSLRSLGFRARGLSRDHFRSGRDAFEMVLPAPVGNAAGPSSGAGGKNPGPGRTRSEQD
jgi:ribosomal protein S18 acetylase RimI-like enzyme